MKPIMMVLGAVIIILSLAAVITAIQDFRSDAETETHAVTTAAGVTSANITLEQDLFLDDNANVSAISSNLTSDTPRASTYTAASNRLLINGLTASGSRTITLTYSYGVLGNYYTADVASRAFPMFLVVGVFGVIAAAVYTGTRRE